MGENQATFASSSDGSGMLDGGSLVGNESASVLSWARSRSWRFSSCVSLSMHGRSSGSRRDPLCSRSFGVIWGLPCVFGVSAAMNPLLEFNLVETMKEFAYAIDWMQTGSGARGESLVLQRI